jgi:hypothetical protein
MSDREAAVGCITAIPVAILAFVVKAWALVILWGWFITPTWHVDAPTKTVALGLSILWGTLTHDPGAARKDTDDESYWTTYTAILVGPVVSVGLGWLVKYCGGL